MPEKIIILKGVSFPGDKTSYLAPSWEEMGQFCFWLAKKIIATGAKFDRLVTLAKGGWTWSRTMADLLHIEKVASVQVEFYSCVGKSGKKPVLLQSLPVAVRGERILIFDDVVDSGKSLPFSQNYLSMCGASHISLATLFYKPWSVCRPDFYMCQTKSWIIFPHEIRESIYDLVNKWKNEDIPPKVIKERFAKIGLAKDLVGFYTKLFL